MTHVITSSPDTDFGTIQLDDTAAARAYIDGAARMAPWLVGIVPYGLVLGAVISSSTASSVAGFAGGPLIFGGSAHFAVLELVDARARLVVVLLTALIVQSRLLLYSASLAPHWQETSVGFRAIASALIVDPTYAVATEIYEEHPGVAGHRRYLGAGALLAVAWFGAIATGFVVGPRVPDGLHFDYAIPLFLLGHVVRMCGERASRTTAIVASATAVVAAGAPLHLGLLLGIVVGVATGDATNRKHAS